MNQYDHIKIEKKWQKHWESKKVNKVKEDSKKKKFFALVEFPYPSGTGLHVGHIRSNTAMDIVARKRRREGYNVLYPMGWDAFGLPTENYAIKTGIPPHIVTKQNTDTFRKQLKSLGFSFDWSREIDTTDPKYYRWTQWIFLQFLKKGLAYKKKMSINWCPKDLIGLANEEVINGCCERCGTPVEKKEKEQWMLAITKYADRLDTDLNETDFLEKIKIQQRNWIGKSEGAEIDFPVVGGEEKIRVFTTRIDTIHGVTYVVLAPEHPLVEKFMPRIENKEEVHTYISRMKTKTDVERTDATSEKTGVMLKGIMVINPANGEKIPVWIADYALLDYGTGAVMAVPAHDERDKMFAEKYGLPVRDIPLENKEEMTKKFGTSVVKYKLRDWIFSRQRYWGEPIPVIHCASCGIVPVPEKNLPVKLPRVKNYAPTETGESPLSLIDSWVMTKCPQCKGKARRETDTMPNWAGSSWYYLRYTDPKNKKAFASKKNLEYWTPVDWYNGGMEHTTLHLLYSRFWHKFLFDIGLVPTKEPYQKRTSHGLILAGGGEKMSKSKGNVVNPDDIVNRLGADTLRVHEMFMGPFDQAIAWDMDSIAGSRRFIERIWKLQEKVSVSAPLDEKLETVIHKTIQKVSDDIEGMRFNTAISAMMIALNECESREVLRKDVYEIMVQLLAPFAPHVTEEIWSLLKNKVSVHQTPWPIANPEKMVSSVVTIVVQVNSKVKARFEASRDMSDDEMANKARMLPEIEKALAGKAPLKTIVVKGKLVNFVA